MTPTFRAQLRQLLLNESPLVRTNVESNVIQLLKLTKQNSLSTETVSLLILQERNNELNSTHGA